MFISVNRVASPLQIVSNWFGITGLVFTVTTTLNGEPMHWLFNPVAGVTK